MTGAVVFELYSDAEMVACGAALGAALSVLGSQEVLVVYFEGDLGAGKTTLCRGILQAFGHRGAVKSPTYTLVEPYSFSARQVCHFDLYRLGDPEELEYMGIRDYFEPGNVCLIEWPERGEGILQKPDVELVITMLAGGRRVSLRAYTPQGEQVLISLSASHSGGIKSTLSLASSEGAQ